MSSKLTIKQEKFAKAYVANGGNGKAAAEVAGYATESENCLRVIASENLTKPNVAQAVHRERMKLQDDPDFSPEAIAARLKSYESALANDANFKAAAEVAMNQAKLAGHLVDKTQNVNNLSDEQLQEELEKLRKGV
jgi:phage terminase small subunit